MKLQYKPVTEDSFNSIYVKRVKQPYEGGNWHFHKEFELIYFLEGQGMRIVGDHISHFEKGEFVLVGEWLPHLWRNDAKASIDADFIVVKFPKEFHGVNIFALPELGEIRLLLKKSYRGIQFPKRILPEVHSLLLELSESHNIEKIIYFLRLFRILSNVEDYQMLASADFTLPTQIPRENRLQKVIDFISANYDRIIPLAEVSAVAYMTPPAFCRFFKHRTNKTFSHFLNEFRINKACQLLINGEKPIKQICFEAGFNSLTNFNRTFRNLKGTNPSSYKEDFKEKLDFDTSF